MIKYVPLARWAASVVPIDQPFAALDDIAWLPLAEGELLLCAHYYPLAVRLDGAKASIGVITRRTMLARGLTGPSGQWLGAYTPVALRCFPLRLSGAPTDDPLADLEVANLARREAKPRLLRIRTEENAPTKELKSVHEGLKSVWDGQQRLQAALDLLLVAGLLIAIPSPDPEASDHADVFFTVDRGKFTQLSNHALEAFTRSSFAALDLVTVLTFSQAHLRADLRPPAVVAPSSGDAAAGGADSTLAAGIDTITPWLDTSELFPGPWAADPAIWANPEASSAKDQASALAQ